MTLCPKCGAMLLVTTSGEICQNCGWSTFRSKGWVSDNTVNLPLIIPSEISSEELPMIRTWETDINDLTTRVSALETELERLKEAIREKDRESESQEKSTKDKLTLKPCPFCDSRDIHTYEPTVYEVGNDASVECQNPLCGAEIRASTLKMAIAKWNRRVGDVSI